MSKRHLLLFDIDGTLTKPVNQIEPNMVDTLLRASKYFDLAVVGGSDRVKQIHQLQDTVKLFSYAFSENGTVAFDKDQKIFHKNSIAKYWGEEKLKRIINFILHYVADVDVPIKRGTFIEYRNGLINASPIGRNCTQEERDVFHAYNMEKKILPAMADAIRAKFKDDGLFVSIGGQVSMDIFPVGWDKRYCLQFVTDKYEDIHFFGDKVFVGGNDHEIFNHPRVQGHDVIEGPLKTISEIEALIKFYGYE
jgi:phosphomannomutase